MIHIDEEQLVDSQFEGNVPEEWNIMLSDSMNDKDAVAIAQEAWDATRPQGDPMFGSPAHDNSHVEKLVHAVKAINDKGHCGVEGFQKFEHAVKRILKRIADAKAAALEAELNPPPPPAPPVAFKPPTDFVEGSIVEDEAPKTGKLPDTFPGFAVLKAEGITTFEKLRAVPDITKIPGIGPVTAGKIQAELDGPVN